LGQHPDQIVSLEMGTRDLRDDVPGSVVGVSGGSNEGEGSGGGGEMQ